ncbi:MAG: hypothetical protein Q7R39_14445 [Dehalococcoidia bacterium]|nr:hypothetical protein [Dehalococcoidia bacterium]
MVDGTVYCCDLDALIQLQFAGFLPNLRNLVRNGSLKVPEGVFRELLRQTDKLGKRFNDWDKKYSVRVSLDERTKVLLVEMERKYGNPFQVGGVTYPGFWQSAAGRKAADGQVVAFPKSRGWVAISNDGSIHGACMLENVPCRRWEEVGRLLRNATQLPLPL